MASTLVNLNRPRQQVREESNRLTRLLNQSRQQFAVATRWGELAKDRRRRIGLRILAMASDALTLWKSHLKSELSIVSELVADSEYEEISKEFLALSAAEVNALTDHMDATRCTGLQQAIDWTVKLALHAWTSYQNLAKGIAPTVGVKIRQRQVATGPSHAAPAGDKQEEHGMLRHLQVAAQLEAVVGDAVRTFSVTETHPALK